MAAAQTLEGMSFYHSPDSGTTPVLLPHQGIRIWCDTSTGASRPIVPLSMAGAVFDAIHSLSHGGPKPTIRAITDRFVWRGMRRDIQDRCGQCHACQTAKVSRQNKAPLQKFPASRPTFRQPPCRFCRAPPTVRGPPVPVYHH